MQTTVIRNIRVGKPKTKRSAPSHVRGVREGNAPGKLKRMLLERGIHFKDGIATGTGARSTGINAKARSSIVPGSPNLSPA